MSRWLTGILLLLELTGVANADVFRPAYLELRELGGDQYAVLWKFPIVGNGRQLSARVQFPDGTRVLAEPQIFVEGGARSERFSIERSGGLVGESVLIVGNAAATTDVIARVQRLDGSEQVERLAPNDPRFVVRAAAGSGEIAWSYTVLGFEHILGGFDHLLFVLALLLIVSGARRVIATITAFTVAHSITLAAATLGWLNVPGPPVEAVISLSILLIAVEVIHARRGRLGLTARAPWIVAFVFGLLHGLGFAGALAEVGLPQTAIPLALLMFNVGVELGQLSFVAAVLGSVYLVTRGLDKSLTWAPGLTAYGIGAMAAFWTVERVVSFWP